MFVLMIKLTILKKGILEINYKIKNIYKIELNA
jgi:hypothetical protein